jgi:hypothetical protein
MMIATSETKYNASEMLITEGQAINGAMDPLGASFKTQ